MTWIPWLKTLGEILVVVGSVVAVGYSRKREGDDSIPADFAALRLQTSRRRLARIGVMLALLGVAAQFAGGLDLSMWG